MTSVRMRILLTIAAAVAAFACTAAEMRAQGGEFRETVRVRGSSRPTSDYTLTFSSTVALPGVELPRGTYTFHSPAAHVVQVSSADGAFYSMFATVATTRTEPTAHFAIVVESGTGPQVPRRIVAIFAPGELTGEQFVYPKE